MKRILVLTNNSVGLFAFRRELLEQLIQAGYRVYIALPYGNRVEYFKTMGCQYINTPLERHGTNPITDFKLILSYKKIIKAVKPDVVLTYTIKPNIYGGIACRSSKVPYIPNVTGLGSAINDKKWMQSFLIWLYRIAFRKAQTVFFQNEANEQFFTDKRIAVGKHRIIPGSGVNLEHYQVLKYPSEKEIHFLFIARVMKEKGIEEYLQAAQVIRKRRPDVHFHILGFCEEAYEQKLADLQAQGVIEYHGLQDDVRAFHRISHCTIHPTYYPEGMSNVLLESAACGRPVITTDRSGCKEIVENGKTGYLIPERDAKELIAKIEEFLALPHNDKIRMGLAGREHVENKFDRQIVIGAYLEEISIVIDS